MLTSGGMTGQADKLCNAGLIVRRPDPDDRRAVLMALTAEGRDRVGSALESYVGASEDVLDVLSEQERLVLAELLRKLLVGLEGARSGVAPGPKSAKPKPVRPAGRFGNSA